MTKKCHIVVVSFLHAYFGFANRGRYILRAFILVYFPCRAITLLCLRYWMRCHFLSDLPWTRAHDIAVNVFIYFPRFNWITPLLYLYSVKQIVVAQMFFWILFQNWIQFQRSANDVGYEQGWWIPGWILLKQVLRNT